MPLRRLLIALAALLVLGGGLWWSRSRKKAEESKPAADSAPKVLEVPEDQIAAIEIRKRDGSATVLQRTAAGKWELAAPKALPVDPDAVSGVTGTLSSLAADQVVDEKPGDLSPFGLAAPELTVAISRKDGRRQQLLFGEEAPTSGLVYVKLDGDPKVYAVSTSLRTSLDKGWQELRDKRLLTFDSDKLSRVEVTANQQTFEFGRNAQNEWQILRPQPFRADGWQVEELIRKLRDAKLDPAGSDEDARKAAGLFAAGRPVAVARVTDASGTQTIEVRKNKEDFYAKSSVVEGVHKVSSDVGAGLDKGVEDYRNKKLFDFGFSDPTGFEVKEEGKAAAAFRKSGEKWTSGGKEMDNATVQQFIDRLRELQASKFVDSGFTSAVLELSVTSNDGKRTERVQFSRKSPQEYIARRENEPALYQVEGSTVDDLLKGFRDIKPAAGAGKK